MFKLCANCRAYSHEQFDVMFCYKSIDLLSVQDFEVAEIFEVLNFEGRAGKNELGK